MSARVAGLAVFALSMAFIEAAVVVYLRAVLGGGPIFPMRDLPGNLLAVEVIREAATLAMLLSVSFLSVRGGLRRMGAFLLTFALWDVFYYVFLRLAIGWPSGLSEWDILFLIPLPWVGPVWSVLLICMGMIVFSALFLSAPERSSFSPGRWGWATGAAGTATVVLTYVAEWKKIGFGRGIPSDFDLLPFFSGVALLAVSGWITLQRGRVLRRW